MRLLAGEPTTSPGSVTVGINRRWRIPQKKAEADLNAEARCPVRTTGADRRDCTDIQRAPAQVDLDAGLLSR